MSPRILTLGDLEAEIAQTRIAYIEAAGYAAAAVIARAELGGLWPWSDPRYLAAKCRWQTVILMRRHRVSL